MRPNCLSADFRHRLHGRGVGDIADMNERLAAPGLDLASDGIRFGAVAAGIHQNGRAGLRQRQRDGAADIAPRPGDDGDLAAEFVVTHFRPLGLSSSAKADDPVNIDVSDLTDSAAITGCPAFAWHDSGD